MGKHNTVSGVLVLIVILMIAISTVMVVGYATGVLTAAVAFASTDQVAKLQACGVSTPDELFKLRSDIPNLLLPLIYVGFPSLMVILSIMMFIAGHYYGNGNEGHSSSETTTTTSSSPNKDGGRYEQNRRVERTQKSSRNEKD